MRHLIKLIAVLLLSVMILRPTAPINNKVYASPKPTAVAVSKPIVVVEPVMEPQAVEPTPVPQVQVAVHPVGCEAYRAEVAKYDWNVEVALAVIFAESGCNPANLNNNPSTGDYSVGLFQINLYGRNALTRPSEEELKNPTTNIAWAYKLYSGNRNSFIGQWGVCRRAVSCY